ncbi:MAG: hypothetical protein KGL39_19220 [Patescibacteria group bacterium]|nr:hypothetical protein [Patescibacteria group bacterium]
MANSPTIGVFIPGNYLNACNSAYMTGAGDAYGNTYATGLTIGKVIEIGTQAAASLTNPAGANQLFEGAYQWIQVDSGATAAYVQPGRAAFIKLDPGGTAGVNPEIGFVNLTVTSQDQADSINLRAGVFIEAIPPGNYGFIFVGAGRVEVTYRPALTNGSPALGDAVGVYTSGNGLFDDISATTINLATMGRAVVVPVANGTSPMYVPDIIYRLPAV